MCALLAHHYSQPLRWTTKLCTVTNLKYSFRMTVLGDDTSSNITLLNYALTNVVTYSFPCLVACSSLAMRSFSAIKNLTLELVASVYALVSSANAGRCLHTLNTNTRSPICTGDTWTSRVGTLRDCTTLCCDSSKDMLCIFAYGLSSRILVSP